MSKSNIIRGSGGGGKSGGGSVRVAQEAPDSLRSQQFARVVDLVSEGEIGGLVNGLGSVYLDDTPIQNADGTFNFDGVSLVTRNGTQDQTHIAGFSSVESEKAVSVEIKQNTPITRTITDATADFARITLSVPRLTRQNTTNGDITGTSVTVAIDMQSNGAGFVAQTLSTDMIGLSVSGMIANTGGRAVIAASVIVKWVGGEVRRSITTGLPLLDQPVALPQSIEWQLNYREVGSTAWIPLQSGSFSGTGRYITVNAITNLAGTLTYFPPTASTTVAFNPSTEAVYEFQLVKISGDGTLTPSGNAFVKRVTDIISGKTSSRYQRAYKIPLIGEPPYDIRVRRITADSTSQSLQNQTFWDSYTEILDQKFRYPNSALMALSIDSERFSRIPARGYEIKGIIVEVPANYNPTTREYTGVWDGTFKNAWTDNPAWIFRDMIVNERYGAGQFISTDIVDKWALYEISQYCDEFVSSGLGGQEPRFTCNVYLQKPEDAFKVIQSLASVFRAIAYYADGSIIPVQDAPKDPVALFNPANVVEGQFNYSGSSAKTRATVCLVTWNDPTDRYRQSIEYVEDEEGIRNRGVITKEITAIGTTSRGQAHRFGKAVLFSEKMETETVTFSAGLDGLSIAPGDVIQTSDPVRAGERLGGRIVTATTTEVTLDSDVTLDSTSTYTLWAIMPNGSVESRTVTNSGVTTSILTVSAAYSDVPQNYSIWVLGSSSLLPETWRVIGVEEIDKFTAQVTALEYRSDKYDAIERGVILDRRPTTSLQARTQDPVTGIVIEEELYLVNQTTVGTSLLVSWTGNASYYDVEYKRENENYTRITSSATSIDVRPVTAGNYTFRITAINALGIRSQPEITKKTVFGLTVPPADVSNFAIQAIGGNAHFSFDASTDLDVIVGGHLRIRHSPLLTGAKWSSAVNIGQQLAGTNTNVVLPLISGTYLAKWVDSSGNQSVNATLISTNAPSVINLNFIETIKEQPTFSGVRDDVSLVDDFEGEPALILDSDDTVGSVDLISNITLFARIGGQGMLGYYTFANSVDLGSVVTSIVTPTIRAKSYNSTDLVSLWDLISSRESIAGNEASRSQVRLQSRTSDDNTTFTAWSDFNVGEVTARTHEFRIVFETDTQDQNVALLQTEVKVDMPDKIQSGDDLTATTAGLRVNYSNPFFVNPAVGVSAQGMATGDYYELTNKTKAGFDILFKNSSGVAIERTFDYIARAY
ncbi:MAG: phage tail protein [Gammaproteobacteria bacterium]|nr:phage tail protein [Gammaproteobacteria bacterium]